MNKKERCVYLRKAGKSYREIALETSTPLTTVCLWTKNIKQTPYQKQYLHAKSLLALQKGRVMAQIVRKKKYNELISRNFILGKETIGDNLTDRELTCLCVGLYWGEGFRKDRRLGFANSDPIMIKIFLGWLVYYLQIPKDVVRLRVGINSVFQNKITTIEDYWSKITGIPMSQFQKPFFQNTRQKRTYKNRKNYYGVLRIRANGQNDKFQQILGLIEGIKEHVDCHNLTSQVRLPASQHN